MAERMGATLAPKALREVAETNWNNAADVARVREHAKQLFEQLVAPFREQGDAKADERAREWTIGALTAAFPRNERARIRSMIRELVGKMHEPSNRAFKVGDAVVVEQFYKHASGGKNKPINAWNATIVRETPKRWVLSCGDLFDKSTGESYPQDKMYVVRIRHAS